MKFLLQTTNFMVVVLIFLVSNGAEASGERDKSQRDHHFQGVANMTTGTGWYLVAPYDKNLPEKACGYEGDNRQNEAEPVCTGRTTWYMDFLGGFGVRPGLEILMMYRQGVESATLGNPQTRRLGAGFKVYKPANSLIKMGFGVIPLFDFSTRPAGSEERGDFVIHVPILLQFDVVRWFGAYGQVAPNLSFISEFRFDINFGIGIQGRFP